MDHFLSRISSMPANYRKGLFHISFGLLESPLIPNDHAVRFLTTQIGNREVADLQEGDRKLETCPSKHFPTEPFASAHSGSPERTQVERSFFFHSSMVRSSSNFPLAFNARKAFFPLFSLPRSCGDSRKIFHVALLSAFGDFFKVA